MKKLTLLFTILVSCLAMQAKNLKALFDYKTFYAPGQGSYIETYLSVKGSSVHYRQNESGTFEAAIEVGIIIKEGDVIKYTDKYNLVGPALKDTLRPLDFMDNKRVQLSNGDYTLELTLVDKNGSGKVFNLSQPVKTNYSNDKVAVSGIELASSFSKSERLDNMLTKNGFEIIPQVDNYYPESLDNLKFYAEIYNTNKIANTDAILIQYYFQNFESGKMLDNYGTAQRKNVKEVIPILSEISIKDLPSGNYELVLEVKDKSNTLLASNKVLVQRHSSVNSNSYANTYTANTFVQAYTDKNVLAEDIASLYPLSNAQQSAFINNQLKGADLEMMKTFFLDFWQKQDPLEPQKAWLDYKAKVDAVQKKYGTNTFKGYNTDMGRVYLSYGPPNSISKGEFEPNTYPYEIWHYNKIKTQSNKQFVFYNTDLLVKNYKLLHSDMTGEVYQPSWELIIHKMIPSTSIDDEGKDIKDTYSGDKSQNNYNTK